MTLRKETEQSQGDGFSFDPQDSLQNPAQCAKTIKGMTRPSKFRTQHAWNESPYAPEHIKHMIEVSAMRRVLVTLRDIENNSNTTWRLIMCESVTTLLRFFRLADRSLLSLSWLLAQFFSTPELREKSQSVTRWSNPSFLIDWKQ